MSIEVLVRLGFLKVRLGRYKGWGWEAMEGVGRVGEVYLFFFILGWFRGDEVNSWVLVCVFVFWLFVFK